jgi:bifunctional non-homologous end joining protein LigD
MSLATGFVPPCIPTRATKPPAGPNWVHEIKHDGYRLVCGPDGVAIFDALHRRGTVSEAMMYAFDLLELDGKDLRDLPLGDRKKQLRRLVGKRRLGIVVSEHTGEDGATIFLQACKMGLGGIVSKRLSAPVIHPPTTGPIVGATPAAAVMKEAHAGRQRQAALQTMDAWLDNALRRPAPRS